MGASHDKGKILEYAVHRILEVFHRDNPNIAQPEVLIERNKRIRIAGITHEVDVWVTCSASDKSRTWGHIVECKNWNKPVGTDEVYKLIGKRDTLEAESATLIAHKFTADAEKLAKLKSIQLLAVADRFNTAFDSVRCLATTHQTFGVNLTIHFTQAQHSTFTEAEYFQATCTKDGKLVRLDTYVEQLILGELATTSRADPRSNLEGMHHGRIEFRYDFEKGEMQLNGDEVRGMTIRLAYVLEITAGELAGRFDVEQRGGFIRITYPPGTFDNQNPSVEILTAPSPALPHSAKPAPRPTRKRSPKKK
jgi:hypothetical protein